MTIADVIRGRQKKDDPNFWKGETYFSLGGSYPMKAVIGRKKTPHFAFKRGAGPRSSGSGESAAHQLSKVLVSRLKTLSLDFSGTGHKFRIPVSEAVVEKRLKLEDSIFSIDVFFKQGNVAFERETGCKYVCLEIIKTSEVAPKKEYLIGKHCNEVALVTVNLSEGLRTFKLQKKDLQALQEQGLQEQDLREQGLQEQGRQALQEQRLQALQNYVGNFWTDRYVYATCLHPTLSASQTPSVVVAPAAHLDSLESPSHKGDRGVKEPSQGGLCSVAHDERRSGARSSSKSARSEQGFLDCDDQSRLTRDPKSAELRRALGEVRSDRARDRPASARADLTAGGGRKGERKRRPAPLRPISWLIRRTLSLVFRSFVVFKP